MVHDRFWVNRRKFILEYLAITPLIFLDIYTYLHKNIAFKEVSV